MNEKERLIVNYVKKYEKVHPAKISRDLKIEFSEVMRITSKFIKEGILEIVDND